MHIVPPCLKIPPLTVTIAPTFSTLCDHTPLPSLSLYPDVHLFWFLSLFLSVSLSPCYPPCYPHCHSICAISHAYAHLYTIRINVATCVLFVTFLISYRHHSPNWQNECNSHCVCVHITSLCFLMWLHMPNWTNISIPMSITVMQLLSNPYSHAGWCCLCIFLTILKIYQPLIPNNLLLYRTDM